MWTFFLKPEQISPKGETYYSTGVRRSRGEERRRKILMAYELDTGTFAWKYPQIGNGHLAVGPWRRPAASFFLATMPNRSRPWMPGLASLSGISTLANTCGSPMSYAVTGKQYVAIAAGTDVFSFALPNRKYSFETNSTRRGETQMFSNLFTRRAFAGRFATLFSGLGLAARASIRGAASQRRKLPGRQKNGLGRKTREEPDSSRRSSSHNGVIYIAGQGAHSHDQGEFPMDIETHTKNVMENVKHLVETGGGTHGQHSCNSPCFSPRSKTTTA